jgi:uncharacterized protein
MKIDGSFIVLTGCGSGIGAAILAELLQYDCRVLACDLHIEALPKSTKVIPHQCNLALPAEIDGVFTRALELAGRIDLFIANAGFAYYEDYTQPDWQRLERIYALNVLSPLYTLAKMKSTFGPQPWRVLFNASAMAFLGVPGYAVYSSTKAAVHSFADTVRFDPDMARRVSVLYPIATRTNFFKQAGQAIPVAFPTQSAQAVARAAIYGIKAGHLRIKPSKLFSLMMLLDRVLPFLLPIYRRLEQAKFKRWLATRT